MSRGPVILGGGKTSFACGTYIGDNRSSRLIELGFEPCVVIILSSYDRNASNWYIQQIKTAAFSFNYEHHVGSSDDARAQANIDYLTAPTGFYVSLADGVGYMHGGAVSSNSGDVKYYYIAIGEA